MRPLHRLPALPLVLVSIAGLLATTADSAAERFRLELTGSPLASYSMTCFAENGGEQTRIRRREYLPQTYIIQAEALHCTIALLESHGRLFAKLLDEKERVIAEIGQSAFFGRITLHSKGSWGAAGASRGAVPFRPESP